MALGFGWQFRTVQKNYLGDWSGLFCIGAETRLPPSPHFDKLHRFPGTRGFDGQIYLLMSHDPFMRNGISAYVAWPGLRYKRILIPAAAYAVALGREELIVPCYIGVNLIFLFLGSWWLSRLSTASGKSPFWGLLYLLMPAVLISLDRLTIDMALLSLALGCVYYWHTGDFKKLVITTALACLTRETGFLIGGSFLVYLATSRRWKEFGALLLGMTPALSWHAAVMVSHPQHWSLWIPESGIPFWDTVHDLWMPEPSAYSPLVKLTGRLLSLGAFGGFVASIVLAFKLRNRLQGPIRLCSMAFCGLSILLLALDDWTHVYDYGRVCAPLYGILASYAIAQGQFALLIPTALMSVRVLLQMAPQMVRAWAF